MADTDPPAAARFSCKSLTDGESGQVYFVALTHYPAADGALEDSTFDLDVTDCRLAWRGTGFSAADVKGLQATKMLHVLAALSDLESSQHTYIIKTKLDGRQLVLSVAWTMEGMVAGKKLQSLDVVLRISLEQQEESSQVLAGMLSQLVENLMVMHARTGQLEQQNAKFEKTARTNERLVEAHVKQREQWEKDMNLKTAALLNAKKVKLREMREELEQLKARKGGGGSDAAGEDSVMRDAGPSTSVRGKRSRDEQQQGHSGDTESTDEDDSDEELQGEMSPDRDMH